MPLEGYLDLTYRCNNFCLHCWLWESSRSSRIRDELSLEEIKQIIESARAMGCQSWSISGGEPMLRPDFTEIFDYITRRSAHYNINTNGTLITPEIARLMTRKGRKMVALYGATAEVHDQVTRAPGSFESTMRGFSYLKEAGAGFEVQIVPMRTNYHQYNEMLELARTLSSHYRMGAPWLWLTASGSENRNLEIQHQRLDPIEVIHLDEPSGEDDSWNTIDGIEDKFHGCSTQSSDDRLFAACIEDRNGFHIDPYGQMSFCYYVKDPALRYDLRHGTFQQAWEEFIPSISNIVRGGKEYLDNCCTCELRKDCRWCGLYSYLEHGRYSARVDYLCQVAGQKQKFKEERKSTHNRYYEIAGITIKVVSDFEIKDKTFLPVLSKFRVNQPGFDTVTLHLFSKIPAIADLKLGLEVYHKEPWVIYKQKRSWVYLGVSPSNGEFNPNLLAIFTEDHSRGSIYRKEGFYDVGGLNSLTTFPSDQILLARILPDRQACYLHASGINLDGNGYLFVGHSEAGKSTMMKMLSERGEILCDDRVIVRRWPDGFRIHGTWSHGELPDVSSGEAPLRAIFFLEQAKTNEIIPIVDNQEKLGKVLSHVIKPLVTTDWWEKTLVLAGKIVAEVPIYQLRFDKSGHVVDQLRNLFVETVNE